MMSRHKFLMGDKNDNKKSASSKEEALWHWATTYSPTFFRQYHRRGRS